MRRPEHIPPPTHRSRRFAGALICAAALLLAPTAVAAQSFNVDIASPADGATLDITNPAFYDAATGRFRFTGTIKVPYLQRSDFHVTIQGRDFAQLIDRRLHTYGVEPAAGNVRRSAGIDHGHFHVRFLDVHMVGIEMDLDIGQADAPAKLTCPWAKLPATTGAT